MPASGDKSSCLRLLLRVLAALPSTPLAFGVVGEAGGLLSQSSVLESDEVSALPLPFSAGFDLGSLAPDP